MHEKIQLWSEGFAATGEYSTAIFHGEFDASNLKKAVQQFKNTLPEEDQELIDIKHLTYWGCKFFNNKEDASKNFG